MAIETDINAAWESMQKIIMTKPLEKMTTIELVERLGVYQLIAHKASKESERIQEEITKLMDFKAQSNKNN